MGTVKSVAGIIPGVMSIGLAGKSLKFLPNGKKLKKAKPKKIVPLFIDVAVGVPLIKTTAGMVAKLP